MKKQNDTELVNEAPSQGFVKELLNNGRVKLTAQTRDELADLVNSIPAETKYVSGAIGRNPETGEYSIIIDLIP